MRSFPVVVLLLWEVLAQAWSAGGAAGLGLPRIGYVNEVLAALAERSGSLYEPLGVAGFVQATLRPWPVLGVSLIYAGTQGALVGRERYGVSVGYVEMAAQLGWSFSFFGTHWATCSGAGVLWAWVSGPLEGSGIGLSGVLLVEGDLWRGAGIRLSVVAGYRLAGVGSLRTGREEFRPRAGPALDLSGPFLGLQMSWEG